MPTDDSPRAEAALERARRVPRSAITALRVVRPLEGRRGGVRSTPRGAAGLRRDPRMRTGPPGGAVRTAPDHDHRIDAR